MSEPSPQDYRHRSPFITQKTIFVFLAGALVGIGISSIVTLAGRTPATGDEPAVADIKRQPAASRYDEILTEEEDDALFEMVMQLRRLPAERFDNVVGAWFGPWVDGGPTRITIGTVSDLSGLYLIHRRHDGSLIMLRELKYWKYGETFESYSGQMINSDDQLRDLQADTIYRITPDRFLEIDYPDGTTFQTGNPIEAKGELL